MRLEFQPFNNFDAIRSITNILTMTGQYLWKDSRFHEIVTSSFGYLNGMFALKECVDIGYSLYRINDPRTTPPQADRLKLSVISNVFNIIIGGGAFRHFLGYESVATSFLCDLSIAAPFMTNIGRKLGTGYYLTSNLIEENERTDRKQLLANTTDPLDATSEDCNNLPSLQTFIKNFYWIDKYADWASLVVGISYGSALLLSPYFSIIPMTLIEITAYLFFGIYGGYDLIKDCYLQAQMSEHMSAAWNHAV